MSRMWSGMSVRSEVLQKVRRFSEHCRDSSGTVREYSLSGRGLQGKGIEPELTRVALVQSRKVYTEYFSGSIDTNLTLDEILSYLDVDNKFMWRKKGKTIVITDR